MASVIYKFEDAFGEGHVVKGGHTLKLSIAFYQIGSVGGEDTVKLCGDYGIKMISWGELEIGELDESIINFSEYRFSFYDSEDELFDFLIDPATPNVYDKSALVTLSIKYSGEESYVEKYKGYLDQESLDDIYDYKTKIFSFSAFPRTDILKQYKLHKDSGSQIGYALNPLGYTISEDSEGGHTLDWIHGRKLVDVITDIYKKIDSNVTLTVLHSMTWRGFKGAEDYHDFTDINDIYLGIPSTSSTSVYQRANDSLLMQIFGTYNTFFELDNLADVLKKLAFSFLFSTGMVSADKAFIKEWYRYDSGNTQSLGTIKSIRHGFAATKDAVRIKCRRFNKDQNEKNSYKEYVLSNKAPAEYVLPINSELRGDAVIEDEVITWGYPYPSGEGTVFAVYNTYLYRIINAQKYHVAYNYFLYINGYIQCATLWTMRGTFASNLLTKFFVNGINYDFLKDFAHGGNGYQVVKLKTNFDDNSSEITALKIVDVADDPGVTPIDAPDLKLGTLASGFYKTYQYVAEITYQDANAGQKDIITVPANCYVKDIEVIIVTGFDLTEMYFDDNEETLIPADELTFDLDNQSIRQVIMKNYLTQQTIKMYASGTAAHGAANVVVTILKRE